VRRLAPDISARAGEIEAARRLPHDLLDQLTAAGCFRTFVPSSHGGAGADLASGLRVLEALGEADAAVGWTVGIGAISWFNLANMPQETFDSVYANGPDVIGAGVFSPSGIAAAVDNGYRVNGRWSFASGCEHADWIFANCIDEVDGEPQMRTVLFSPSDVAIEDTWNVSGLAGTGSHHIRVDDLFVPVDKTSPAVLGEPTLDLPIARIPLPALFAQMGTSVALGAAQGALKDILDIAGHKLPLLSPSALAGNPLFQNQLALADTELRAARALFYDTAEEAWATSVLGGSPMTDEQRARTRAASVWATARAVAVVDMAYHAGGGTSLYVDSPLQRRLRDAHAMTQSFLVKPDVLTTAGAVLAGQDVDLTIF
jgi:alkylation response protein AidB-like acyl-CoA dehydrogenase